MERALIPARRRLGWTTSAREIFGPGSPDRRQRPALTVAVARRKRAVWLGRKQASFACGGRNTGPRCLELLDQLLGSFYSDGRFPAPPTQFLLALSVRARAEMERAEQSPMGIQTGKEEQGSH